MFKRSFGGDQIKAFPSDFSRLETVGHTNVQTLNHNLNSFGDEFLADLGSYYLNPLNLFQMGFVLIATWKAHHLHYLTRRFSALPRRQAPC